MKKSTGEHSTGTDSTGYRSTGDRSTGDRSTGDRSTGDRSTGYWSTGDWSTGDCSTGHWSTGSGSIGYASTGLHSTGNYSTGDRSTGDHSTGDWSISNYSTGHFSTEDYSGFGCFDKPCSTKKWEKCYKPDFLYFELTEWIEEGEMTGQEKKDNPSYQTTRGYLKVHDYKEAFLDSWNNADPEDRMRIKELPNFCPKKFKEISGIDISLCETSIQGIDEPKDGIREELENIKLFISKIEKGLNRNN